MKHLITVILIIITTSVFGQTLPELVEKGFSEEMNVGANKFSKVDFDNIDQGLINKLIAKKIRNKQIIHNPLNFITGGKQKVNTSAVKAAKHHTLYIAKAKRLGHTEASDEFKTFSKRYKFYSGGDFGSIITKGEVCNNFKIKGWITYQTLINQIIKVYFKSKSHKEIILENSERGDFLGTYVVINKNGWVYNTIIFP